MSLARQLLPPFLYDALRRRLRPAAREPVRYTGRYASWADARRDSAGYDDPVILERTRAAMLRVRQGEAVFERDGVLLPAAEPPLPLLAGLLRAAALLQRPLHVVDFGGALGSTCHQCRPLLPPGSVAAWSVVEQPAHVACGNREFADGQLAFYPDLDAALGRAPGDVLLLSSVLPFLPDPGAFLAGALARRIPHVIVDRTFFHAGPGDLLTVQHVPAWIYPASYPAWFLDEAGFRARFAPAYRLVAEFPALDQPVLPDRPAWAKGMIHQLNP